MCTIKGTAMNVSGPFGWLHFFLHCDTALAGVAGVAVAILIAHIYLLPSDKQ